MRAPIRWIALAVGLVVLGTVVIFAVQVSRRTAEPSLPRLVLEHASVPDFTVQGLDGKQVSSNDLHGKTYVINFFNSWCIPCRQEAPALKSFYAEHKAESDFAMVGIILDDNATTMRSYVRKEGIEWPVAVDPNGTASLDFGTTGQPETYVIRPDGLAVCGNLGASTVAELDTWVAAARTGQVCTPGRG